MAAGIEYDEAILGILAEEVYIHTAGASAAYDRMEALLAEERTRQSREVWLELQAFFTHAATVSRFLHPPRHSHQAVARATRLADALRYDLNSVIADRHARDYLEHIDERLDLWAALAGSPAGFRPLLEQVYETRTES